MRPVRLVPLLLAAAGCGVEFTPRSVVEDTRVLAIVATPLELGPAQELKIGERAAKLAGYKLTFPDKDADGQLVLGLLGPINEDSGENMVALKKYVKFFQDEKADVVWRYTGPQVNWLQRKGFL